MAVFAKLKARGLDAGVARRLMVTRDGSDAVANAVRHFWPDAVQQECLVHGERGLCAKLSYRHQIEAIMKMNRLRAVDGSGVTEGARRLPADSGA